MNLRLVRAVAAIEESDDLHLGRVLVLLRAAEGKARKPVAGITKLAKLDFLLRYPNCLERALGAHGRDPSDAAVQEFERTNIEAKMIRFRYGPWDRRYRRWISILVAKDLGRTWREGRTVYVSLTERGQGVADVLSVSSDFHDIAQRSRLIARTFGKMSGTRLKERIYETFPEISSLRWGEEIRL